MGFLLKLIKLRFIKPSDAATSTNVIDRKTRYGALVPILVPLLILGASYFGAEISTENATTLVNNLLELVAVIFLIGGSLQTAVSYFTFPKKNEVINVTPPKLEAAEAEEAAEAGSPVLRP